MSAREELLAFGISPRTLSDYKSEVLREAAEDMRDGGGQPPSTSSSGTRSVYRWHANRAARLLEKMADIDPEVPSG